MVEWTGTGASPSDGMAWVPRRKFANPLFPALACALCQDLRDHLVGARTLRFALEIEDDAMAERGGGGFVDVRASHVIAVVEECVDFARQDEGLRAARAGPVA